jgi:hypothetical protein
VSLRVTCNGTLRSVPQPHDNAKALNLLLDEQLTSTV